MPEILSCTAIGRAWRVYLPALLTDRFDKRADEVMHRHIPRFGWVIPVLIVVVGGWRFALR